LVDETEYRSLVGSLRYLVNTRPDLAYSVGYMSRFMERRTEEHLTAAKCNIRYVAWIIHFSCRDEQWSLIGFYDSNLARDIDTSKGTTCVAYFLGKNMVSWRSKKQKLVALSTCEAEYIAAATAACQGMWLSRLLVDLRCTIVKGIKLRVDNNFAIALMKNHVFHFIRQLVEDGEVHQEYICSEEQLTDILTKALSKP
jgi:hypothetical protein